MAVHHFRPKTWSTVLGMGAPALCVQSGDVIVTETLDAHGIDKDGISRAAAPNPLNGPIWVDGAEPGDALSIEILRMTPLSRLGWSQSVLAEGVLEPAAVRGMNAPCRLDWIIDSERSIAHLLPQSEQKLTLSVPIRPMIGCLGVAPPHSQSIWTATSSMHGGNMDLPSIAPGARIFFPVFAPGALFYLGDCHAGQGDGELLGSGIEACFEVEFCLRVQKNHCLTWPRGETVSEIFSIGNARPLDQALQHATTDMFRWLTDDFGLDGVTASQLLGQFARYRIGNVYNPAYTIACGIDRKWLPA